MTPSFSRAALAALFAACALSACSSNSNNPTLCSTAADCPSGDTCTDGQCLAPGQCASGVTSCSTSAECSSGQECTSGCCVAATGCTSSADCTTATKPHCDTTTGQCVACASNTQCPTGKVCQVASGACVASCSSDTQCSGSTPHCVTSGGFCAQCTESSQCPSSAPTCENNVCVGCTSNASCAAPTPVCDTTTKLCVACLDAQNANGKNAACPSATPACESGACVACNPADNAGADAGSPGTNGACSGSTPSCSAANACVACTVSAECGSGAVCTSNNTCQALALAGFTSSASTVVTGGTATLTATLNGPVASATTINIDLAADGGTFGTLSGSTIVISSGATGTATFTAGNTDGTSVIEASFGGTTLSTPITVTSAGAALASVDVTGSPVVGGTVQATVSLTAAPSAATTVAVSVDNGATINGASTANITVPAGSTTSAAFTITLSCSASATTVTAVLSSVTKTATINAAGGSGSAQVASLTSSASTAGSGQPISFTVTLNQAAGCGGTYVTLATDDIMFSTESKILEYVPSSVTVPAGQTSLTFTGVPECTTNTGTSAPYDTIYVSAQVPGTPAIGLATPITMNQFTGLQLCPISPVSGERPLTYLEADGGVAPLPTVLTVGYVAYPAEGGPFTVTLTATGADGGVCGTFTRDGGTLANSTLTLATATKNEVSFLPNGNPGPCTLSETGAGDGGTWTQSMTSTLNLVAYDWTQQPAATDLLLNKAEIDEDAKITFADGGSGFGDQGEYVEIVNPTASSVDLSQYTLVFVGSGYDNTPDGGANSIKQELWSYALSGSIAAGHYAIAQDANTFATAPGATDSLMTWPDAGFAELVSAWDFSATSTSSIYGAFRDGNIANAPGAIFLVKGVGSGSPVIVDGLTYGAPLQNAISASIMPDGGTFSWPPAPQHPNDGWIIDNSFFKGSLVRIGHSGSPALDWTDSTTVTPGAPNTTITGP